MDFFLPKKDNLKSLFTGLFLFGLVVSVPTFSSAQSENDLMINQLDVGLRGDIVLSPARREMFIAPGETDSGQIKVTNRTEHTLNFSISIEDIAPSDNINEALVILPPDQYGPFSLRDFVQPAVREFVLSSGEEITLPFVISIPSNAEPGGLYATILAAASRVDETQDLSGTKLISRVGSHLLVRVAGEVAEEGEFIYFNTSPAKKFYFTQKPDLFELRFENRGNVHTVPYGKITITNLFGREIQSLPMNAFFVLPGSTRAHHIAWSDDQLLFGRYKATADVYVGYRDVFAEKSVVIWVLPIHLILILTLIILVLFSSYRYLSGRYEFRRKNNSSL